VAAPLFLLTNAGAAAPDRSDLINQPQDLRFLIYPCWRSEVRP
jgi:hypothetical protein